MLLLRENVCNVSRQITHYENNGIQEVREKEESLQMNAMKKERICVSVYPLYPAESVRSGH